MTQNQKHQMGMRYFSMPPRFDPEDGTTVFAPEGKGYGFWVGGHAAVYDPETESFFLFHRFRLPLGKGRGHKCRVAQSKDGVHFEPIWEATKDQFDAESIEVGCIIRDPASGRWRLYVSFEKAGTGRWRVDLVEADHPRNFDAWHHRTVMEPGSFGVNTIKDPRVYIVGGLYHAFVSVLAEDRWSEDEHDVRRAAGADATGLMRSPDGVHWRNFQYVFEPGGAAGEWGCFRARINSVLYLPPAYVGFFDAGESAYDNYEEWCSVAISHDLEHWTRVSLKEPWVKSQYGAIRYMDALRVGDEVYYYYEYTRQDGSHEIRVSRASL